MEYCLKSRNGNAQLIKALMCPLNNEAIKSKEGNILLHFPANMTGEEPQNVDIN